MRARQIGMTATSVGAVPSNRTVQLLWELRNANMQSTADQAFTKVFTGTKWAANAVQSTLIAGTITALTAGGIYTAASKAGNALVSAAQLWTAVPLLAALAANSQQTSSALFLSLTVGSLSASTADILIFGYVLD